MAARELRYRYFAQLIEDIDAETVCVAHHRDDAVETLLMNLMRGAGIHGLTGIRPRNGHIARPLLCLSHNDILQALEAIGQTYVIDSTNLETDVLRNKIRLQLIPLLEQMTPSVSRNIARTSLYISEAEKVYDAYFRNLGLHDADRIPVSSLLESPSPLCMLHEWLAPLGFNRTQISEILDAAFSQQSGREFSSSSHILVLDRQSLIVAPDEPPVKPVVIPESGFYRIGESVSLRVSLLDTPSEISRDPSVCTVDASKVRFPLTLRTMHTGDRFVPFGMKGSKLLSDFLTDRKLSLLDKRRQLVLSDANGLIFWVLGIRVADPCRITTFTTSILKIEMQK
jgi:tRNA(Ile)-lysidine synthase